MIHKPSTRLTDAFNARKISCDCAIDVSACRMPSLDPAVDNVILFPMLFIIITIFYLICPLISNKRSRCRISRKEQSGRAVTNMHTIISAKDSPRVKAGSAWAGAMFSLFQGWN